MNNHKDRSHQTGSTPDEATTPVSDPMSGVKSVIPPPSSVYTLSDGRNGLTIVSSIFERSWRESTPDRPMDSVAQQLLRDELTPLSPVDRMRLLDAWEHDSDAEVDRAGGYDGPDGPQYWRDRGKRNVRRQSNYHQVLTDEEHGYEKDMQEFLAKQNI